jgi:hypothetical protein
LAMSCLFAAPSPCYSSLLVRCIARASHRLLRTLHARRGREPAARDRRRRSRKGDIGGPTRRPRQHHIGLGRTRLDQLRVSLVGPKHRPRPVNLNIQGRQERMKPKPTKDGGGPGARRRPRRKSPIVASGPRRRRRGRQYHLVSPQ